MKIFITGGTGFIGKHTIELLSKTNHQLKLLIRKSSEASFLNKPNITLVEGDLTERQSLLRGMEGCDSLINIAGLYTFWEPDKKIFSKVNIEGTRNVMECALESGIKKVVHLSTAGVFGKPIESPFTEESKFGPVQYGEYFRTKFEGEQIAWDLLKKKGLPLVVIYPVCVVGEGDTKASGRYIRDFINRKLPATVFKNRIFSFVSVRDVAKAIVNALEKENNIGEKYLVGNYRYTWGEINKLLSEISRVPLPKINLPESLTMMNAYILTGLANLIKKPPLWGMAVDQMKVMKAGFNVDGSKAGRELGIKYTPISFALQEAIDSFAK
ncbi:MAG: NAD-dependent epimerase/dehydratase family protein [Ignavibacteriaceae bacterium]|nr:NAD-dependent epimerase/dehydratase family protein [Ignavibacteriaceae bacterium]